MDILDRGGLFYPTNEFVSRLCTIYHFVVDILPLVSKSKYLLEDLVNYLHPIVSGCATFSCEVGKGIGSKHNEQLVVDVLRKYISPILKNYSRDITDELMRNSIQMKRMKRAASLAAAESKKSKAASRKLLTVQPFS